MLDQTSALYPLVLGHLRQHDDVKALFPANKVRVFEVAPDNIQGFYIVLDVNDFSPLPAEGLPVGETEFTVRIWSKTDPASKAEAMAAGLVVIEAMASLGGSADIDIRSIDHARSQYLLQPDNATVQGVVVFSVTAEAR